ncbi:Hsp33 family molecular chaperone HslO [Bacteriovoracales bacterium]|nr:Hsp33 family molecular chaperone HslO [Bacteriovoracales bacterium]
MLAESQLYSFLDRKNNFLIHFFEGQKLIQELILIHNLKENGFSYFRDLVLSFQPMISLLKPREGFGIYIDSESPYFRWKIETNWSGQMRTLLAPENFNLLPSKITGTCRFTKISPNSQQPYTSYIELNETHFDQAINGVLTKSFQINSKIQISEVSDQSIMVMELPAEDVDKKPISKSVPLDDYLLNTKEALQQIFQKGLNNDKEIISSFESLGMSLINKREILFRCPCSQERMLLTLKNLWKNDKENFFKKDEKVIEMGCEYCKKRFHFSKEEITQ